MTVFRRRRRTAYLGLGSNVGDRLGHLRGALEALDAHRAVTVELVSAVYETRPWTGGDDDVADQPPYLNAVAVVTTTLPPRRLLELGHDIEQRAGRDRTAERRYGPRPLDVDLLLYDREVIAEPDLTVPHPRLTERAFVLVPLAEVLPAGSTLPDGSTPMQHLARLAPVTGVELHVRLGEGPGTADDPLARRPAGPPGPRAQLGEQHGGPGLDSRRHRETGPS